MSNPKEIKETLTLYQYDTSIRQNIRDSICVYLNIINFNTLSIYGKIMYNNMCECIQNIINKINKYKIEDNDTRTLVNQKLVISLIELYWVVNGYNLNNQDNIISLNVVECIDAGAYNIILLLDTGYIIRIDSRYFNEYTSEYKYFGLSKLKQIFMSDAYKNLPQLVLSSLNILPPEEKFNSKSLVPSWFIERQYKTLKLKEINLHKYIDLIINISVNAKEYGMMYGDWKISNIMKDDINDRYVLVDFDFTEINDCDLDEDSSSNVTNTYSTTDTNLYDILENLFHCNSDFYVTVNTAKINRIYSLFIGLYDIINIDISQRYDIKYESTLYLHYFTFDENVANYVKEFKNKLNSSGLLDEKTFDMIFCKIRDKFDDEPVNHKLIDKVRN